MILKKRAEVKNRSAKKKRNKLSKSSELGAGPRATSWRWGRGLSLACSGNRAASAWLETSTLWPA